MLDRIPIWATGHMAGVELFPRHSIQPKLLISVSWTSIQHPKSQCSYGCNAIELVLSFIGGCTP